MYLKIENIKEIRIKILLKYNLYQELLNRIDIVIDIGRGFIL